MIPQQLKLKFFEFKEFEDEAEVEEVEDRVEVEGEQV